MRIGIAGIQATELVAKSIKETLSDAGFESFYFKNNSKVTLADLIIVLGGDRGVRNYLHSAMDVDTPILGISESESNGVLAQIELKELPSYLNRIKKQIMLLRMYQELELRLMVRIHILFLMM